MDNFSLDQSRSAVDTADEPETQENASSDADTGDRTVSAAEEGAAGHGPTRARKGESEAAGGTDELSFAEARARALAEFDRAFLTAALARHSGNIARTARSLGLHRQSLQKLMARRGIKSGRVPPT